MARPSFNIAPMMPPSPDAPFGLARRRDHARDSRLLNDHSRSIHDVDLHSLSVETGPTPLRGARRMSIKNEKEIVRIDLTQDQKEKVKSVTDKNAEAIEMTVQELEARITPLTLG
jgi:hypothetical protein